MIKSPVERMLSGRGELRGPDPGAQFNRVVELIKGCLPLFADSALKDKINNEDGLNRRLSRFITNVSIQDGLPFFAQPESMEEEIRGDSPAVDIGIHLIANDIASDPPKVTVFEGKRLTNRIGNMRRCEYVFGHEEKGKHVPCDGIERFKLGIHGREFNRMGMVGYIQDGIPLVWQDLVNSWISELTAIDHDPIWSEKEHLMPIKSEGKVASCSSIVYRHSDEIHLTHLWIDLVSSE